MREEEKNAQDWKIDEREWRMLVQSNKRRERNKGKKEKDTQFNVVQHTMYVPTSTATLGELFITCT